jgi:transcriptional regulator with XRE-family HTH domain
MRRSVSGVSKIGDYLKGVLPTGWGEQTALAHRAGITPEALNRVLSGKTKEPGFETIAKVARAAGLDLNRVIAETADGAQVSSLVADLLSIRDRRRLTEFATWMHDRFEIKAEEDNVLEFVPFKQREVRDVEHGEYRFPIPPDQFKQRDFDYPQPWHYWTSDDIQLDEVPGVAAAPRGVPNLLNPRGGDIHEVLDRFNQIVRVVGDSMEDRYFDGDLLRIDTRNRNPLKGEPIAIYCDDLGGSLVGFFKPQGDRVALVKKNKKYDDVMLPPNGWLLIGPVVELVRRVERRERL